MGKCKKKWFLFYFQGCFYFFLFFKDINFDIMGLYLFSVLNSEQNKTNPMPLEQTLREELSTGGSYNWGGFLGRGRMRGIRKNVLCKKFYICVV